MESQILTYHRMIEAFKFAYAKRSALGDEDFVDVKEVNYYTKYRYCFCWTKANRGDLIIKLGQIKVNAI